MPWKLAWLAWRSASRRSRVGAAELVADIDHLRTSLLSTRTGHLHLDKALHEMGVRAFKLQSALEHPGKRLAFMRARAGLAVSGAKPVQTSGPRIVTSARWQHRRAEPGAMIGMQALVSGFPEGTTARFVVTVRGTEHIVGRVKAKLSGDTVTTLWRPPAPEQYVFECSVEDMSSRSDILKVERRPKG